MPELDQTKLIIAAIVVVVLVVGLAVFTRGAGEAAKRQEVPINVDLIRQAEIEYKAAFEDYVSAESAPRDPLSVDGTAVPWKATAGFERLSWSPPQAEVYGVYAVHATLDGFTVTGVCDVDGDGNQARFQATLDDGAQMLTEEAVY